MLSIFSKIKTWLIVAGGVVAAVFLAFLKGRSEGGALERARQQRETIKNLKTRDKVDDEVDQSSDDSVRDDLRGWVRDDEGRGM